MTFNMTGTMSIYPKFVDGAITWSETISSEFTLTNGTGSAQANGYWSDTLSIDAGASETIDLLALAFAAFGDSGTIAFASVKSLVVVNQSATTKLAIGPGATNGWGEMAGDVAVGKSGVFVLHSPVSGLPVGGASKTLTITNTDAVTTLSGNTASASANVTGLSSTTGLVAGMIATGSGIPAGAKISSITNSTSLVLTANATATATGVSIDFEWPPATVKVYAAGILD